MEKPNWACESEAWKTGVGQGFKSRSPQFLNDISVYRTGRSHLGRESR